MAEEERIKVLDREVRELRKANEILRLAVRFSPMRSSAAAWVFRTERRLMRLEVKAKIA